MDKSVGRRFVVMLAAIVIMGAGVTLFKLSFMGNDPYTALVIAIGDRLGVDFALVLLVANCFWFLLEWGFGRKLIGVGTIINWLFVGPLASLYEKAVLALWGAPVGMAARLLVMLAGIGTLSLSCAMYQTADLGIAPYDAISIILSDRTGKSYFWCRMLTDSLCAIGAFLLGGLIGLGTLICALGLGPFISLFTEKVAKPLIGQRHP